VGVATPKPTPQASAMPPRKGTRERVISSSRGRGCGASAGSVQSYIDRDRSFSLRSNQSTTVSTSVREHHRNTHKSKRVVPNVTATKRNVGADIADTSVKRKKLAVAIREADEQFVADHRESYFAPYNISARVYALWGRHYYAASVSRGRDSCGLHEVRFIEDGLVRNLVTTGIIPLTAVTAGKKCVATKKRNGQEISECVEVMRAPSSIDKKDWLKATFVVRSVMYGDKYRVSWEKLILNASQGAELLESMVNAACEIMTENIDNSGDLRSGAMRRANGDLTPQGSDEIDVVDNEFDLSSVTINVLQQVPDEVVNNDKMEDAPNSFGMNKPYEEPASEVISGVISAPVPVSADISNEEAREAGEVIRDVLNDLCGLVENSIREDAFSSCIDCPYVTEQCGETGVRFVFSVTDDVNAGESLYKVRDGIMIRNEVDSSCDVFNISPPCEDLKQELGMYIEVAGDCDVSHANQSLDEKVDYTKLQNKCLSAFRTSSSNDFLEGRENVVGVNIANVRASVCVDLDMRHEGCGGEREIQNATFNAPISLNALEGEEHVFSGIAVVMTRKVRENRDQKATYSRREVREMVEQNGGIVLHDLEPFISGRKLLLIADSHCRTTKYITAVAYSVPCVHHCWVQHCVRMKQLLDYNEYLLPAGESLLTNQTVPWHANDSRLLEGKRVLFGVHPEKLHIPTHLWSPLIQHMGATLFITIPIDVVDAFAFPMVALTAYRLDELVQYT
ncbi:Tumor suppressor p53-binding protein 1, partial [Toxocara canis]